LNAITYNQFKKYSNIFLFFIFSAKYLLCINLFHEDSCGRVLLWTRDATNLEKNLDLGTNPLGLDLDLALDLGSRFGFDFGFVVWI
jgi:hypothetical protein